MSPFSLGVCTGVVGVFVVSAGAIAVFFLVTAQIERAALRRAQTARKRVRS